jgi:hypothetical protein
MPRPPQRPRRPPPPQRAPVGAGQGTGGPQKAAEQEEGAKAKAEEQRIAASGPKTAARARSHLPTLESGQRIARTNDKGEREVLDDKGRADEPRRAREVIANSDCR